MTANSEVLRARLAALYDDLCKLSSDEVCPWPVARLFNAILAEIREIAVDDPIVATMGSVKLAEKSGTLSTSTYGAVRTLVGQLISALEYPYISG